MNNRLNPEIIFQCPLCDAVPHEHRVSFLDDLRYSVRTFEKGETLINQDTRYNSLFILVKGEIITEIDDEKGDFTKIEEVIAPNPLAAGFLFAKENLSPVTAIAKTECVVVVIPKDNIYFLMRKYESFMQAFLLYISNRISLISEKLRLFSLRTIRSKLAYYLLRESKGSDIFRLKTSKAEIAHLCGVTRPALVKVFMEMVEDGIIDVDRRDVRILQRNVLKNMF